MDGYGLVLGGGGAKGGYEIGVWKALMEMDIPICAVAGTSVGALNGAAIVQNDFDLAYELWTSITIERVIKLAKETAAARYERRYSIRTMLNMIKEAVIKGGLDVAPLRELLDEVIDEDKIRRSEIELGIVTYSLSEFRPVRLIRKDIPYGKLVDYLLASACLPVFQTQIIGEKKFIDGGVYDKVPISIMIELGIRDVIAVEISGPGRIMPVDTTGMNITRIKNSEDLGGILEFNPERSKKNIEIGYYDALKKFGKIAGRCYYIVPSQSLSSFPIDWDIIYSTLGLEEDQDSPANKIIIQKIKNTIGDYSANDFSDLSVLVAMAEITAEEMGIDRKPTYTFEGLVKAIKEKYESIKMEGDFDEYLRDFRALLSGFKDLDLESELRKIVMKGKFLIAYHLLDGEEEWVKGIKRFIALAFPKIAVANAFMVLVENLYSKKS